MPVGFVGAADSKAQLRHSGLPAVSNKSEKGGSAVAAAAFNALLRVARQQDEEGQKIDRLMGGRR
jgi:precorrin-8X/cobalt-precorrin-8 methylmutase